MRSMTACLFLLLWAASPTYSQQAGPCGSNDCGPATQMKAQINCGLCGSGYFVLECTCCSLRQPPQCNRELNICSVSQGSCQASTCAKCCSQENIPNGARTCVCLSCGRWMSCSDPDCSGGGSAAAQEVQAVSETLQSRDLPVEFVRDSGGRVRLIAASVDLPDQTLRGINLHMSSGSGLLAYMILTIDVVHDGGESATMVVTVDRTFRPSPLDPDVPLSVAVSAAIQARPVKVIVRTDYVRFAGAPPEGLYRRELEEKMRLHKQAYLRDIEAAIGRISAATAPEAALNRLPGTQSFAVFREVLRQHGVDALLGELRRVRSVLVDLGVR